MSPRTLDQSPFGLSSFADADQFERMFQETDLRCDGRGNVFAYSYGESGSLADCRLMETYEEEEL